MANLRDIRRRITSVKNTRQTTRAMKLVSASKMGKAVERATAAKPYGEAVRRVLGSVADKIGGDIDHPLLTAHERTESICVVVIGSDRGLCGGFNNALFRSTEKFIADRRAEGKTVALRVFGKKARAYFGNRGYEMIGETIDLDFREFMTYTMDLAGHLTSDFKSGAYQECWLASNIFKSVIAQNPTLARVLPLSVEDAQDTGTELATQDASKEVGAGMADYKYEPDAGAVLSNLLPLYLQTLLHQAFLEKEAGEHAARMTAMDNATRNAEDMIDSLTLKYNRARQAAITTELIEIVSGAAAL